MDILAKVDVVRILPPTEGTVSVTALQLRVWEGFDRGTRELHGFAIDDAMAATMEPGQWVTLKKPTARAKKLGPLRRLKPETGYRGFYSIREPHAQIRAISELLQTYGVRYSTQGDKHAASVDVHHKLEQLEQSFDCTEYPLDLLMSCFSEEAAAQLCGG